MIGVTYTVRRPRSVPTVFFRRHLAKIELISDTDHTSDNTIWRSLIPAVTFVVSTGMGELDEFLVFATPSSRPQLSTGALANFWERASDRRRVDIHNIVPLAYPRDLVTLSPMHPLALIKLNF